MTVADSCGHDYSQPTGDYMTEKITAGGPEIGETPGQTEDIKAETEVGSGRSRYPKTIGDLLCEPPVLPDESEEPFWELFESFVAYANPENIIEYHLVHTATVCRWEIKRYSSMAIAVTTNQQQAGLASLFEQTTVTGLGKVAKHLVTAQATKNAMKCFLDSDYREEAYMDFETRGFIPDAQAFLLSLPALATIERLLASAEKRYAVTMKDLERRMASRAAKPAVTNDLKVKKKEG
jgi:hypothetical protein